MHQSTRSKAKKAAVLMLALAVAMAAAGCRTVSPTDMLPEPIASAPASQRFDGSVSVSVTFDARALRYVRPRQMVSLEELSVLTGLSTQALSDGIAMVGDLGLVQIVLESFGPPRLAWNTGRANFQTLGHPEDFGARGISPALAAFAPQYAADWARIYTPRIREAVEKSLTASGLFPRTVPTKGDYALDIWLDGYEPTMPKMGMGTWKADVLAVWRLARASDGAILACDFAEGHGSFRKARSQPNHWAFAAAVQSLVDGILRSLGDDPRKHLAALEPAGLGRIGGSGAMPSAAVQWTERVTAGWPQLRAGMSVDEVSAVIGSVGAPVEGWDCVFILPVYRRPLRSEGTPVDGGLSKLTFRVYKTDLYTLLFLTEDPRGGPSARPAPGPGTLLVWQLKKK
jgi:hypothetical protein